MRTWTTVAAAVLAALVGSACASVPRAATGPAFPDLPVPEIPARLPVSIEVRDRHGLAWKRLQSGDLRGANREYGEALKRSVTFYPAETGLGLVALAGRQYEAAITRFKAAIARDGRYAPALRGLVEAEIAREHYAEALEALGRLLAVDPSLPADRTRLEVLKVRRVQQLAESGRRARENGKLDEASTLLNQALALSPASPLILRELALVDLASGRVPDAEALVRKALQFDAADAETYAALGAVLEKRGRLVEASTVYAKAAAIDPKWRRHADAALAAAEKSGLPDELRDLDTATSVTRGELAAIIGVRLGPLLARAPERPPQVATDVRTHWAAPWITPVTQAGVMDVFTNHTFQPAGVIRRADLARIASRLVPLALKNRSDDLAKLQGARPAIPDLPMTNVNYRAAALSLTAGVMTTDDGRFLPSQPATGAVVLAAIERLRQLAR